MERSVSVSSDRTMIRDRLWRWSAFFFWTIPTENRRSSFDKPVLCPNYGIQKRGKNWQEPFLVVGLALFNRKSSVSLLLEPPKEKMLSTLGARFFYAAAPCLWNSLPAELLDSFKRTHLF